jgi:4-amino-4-deoxy-L-arabinose transferase-like glycosyltransferase
LKRVFGLPLIDWIWILLLSLWRLGIASRHGLGVDEAHYVLYGLKLDWSYFDHPPLIGWIQSFFLSIFGKNEVAARLPSVLSGIISSVLIFNLVGKFSKNLSHARWATVAINASFLAAALWIMFVPDTILLVLTLWLVFIIFRLLERSKFQDWVELGVCLGLCGLTKYTAVFFIFSLLGIIFSERALKKVNLLGVIAVTFIGMVMITPVLYWNAKHHWISFSYQQNHVMGGEHFHYERALTFLLTQFITYSPFLIMSAIWGFWIKRKEWDQRIRVILWVTLPNLVFFAYTSMKDEVLPHWTLTAWALIIPVGLVSALEKSRKVKWAVLVSALITFFVMCELSFQFLKFPPYQSPYADLTGWPELRKELDGILSKEVPGSYSIGVPNWTLGSRAHYYLDSLASVFVLDDRFDQFDLWEENQKKTPNVLILAWRGFSLREDNDKRCIKKETVETKTFLVNGSPVNAVDIFWCRNYRW